MQHSCVWVAENKRAIEKCGSQNCRLDRLNKQIRLKDEAIISRQKTSMMKNQLIQMWCCFYTNSIFMSAGTIQNAFALICVSGTVHCTPDWKLVCYLFQKNVIQFRLLVGRCHLRYMNMQNFTCHSKQKVWKFEFNVHTGIMYSVRIVSFKFQIKPNYSTENNWSNNRKPKSSTIHI